MATTRRHPPPKKAPWHNLLRRRPYRDTEPLQPSDATVVEEGGVASSSSTVVSFWLWFFWWGYRCTHPATNTHRHCSVNDEDEEETDRVVRHRKTAPPLPITTTTRRIVSTTVNKNYCARRNGTGPRCFFLLLVLALLLPAQIVWVAFQQRRIAFSLLQESYYSTLTTVAGTGTASSDASSTNYSQNTGTATPPPSPAAAAADPTMVRRGMAVFWQSQHHPSSPFTTTEEKSNNPTILPISNTNRHSFWSVWQSYGRCNTVVNSGSSMSGNATAATLATMCNSGSAVEPGGHHHHQQPVGGTFDAAHEPQQQPGLICDVRHPWIDHKDKGTNASNNTTTYAASVAEKNRACSDPPGEGWEGGMGAYTLLTQKIKLFQDDDTTNDNNNAPDVDTQNIITKKKIRLFCGVYTHAPLMFDLARSAALTWGSECDGFVAFSNVTVPDLGMVDLDHIGPESYGNMWQKTRSIWKYIYDHYSNDYDYFHLSGDDVYLIVPNLRHFLQSKLYRHHLHHHQQQQQSTAPPFTTSANSSLPHHFMFAGQWIRQKNRPYVGGGPGYTLSSALVKLYVESGTWQSCHSTVTASYEDRLLSQCLLLAMQLLSAPSAILEGNNASLATLTNHSMVCCNDELSSSYFLTDTRDPQTGEQLYHSAPPQQIYDGRSPTSKGNGKRRRPSFHARALAYWETLPLPDEQQFENNINSYSNSTARSEETWQDQVSLNGKPRQQPLWVPVETPEMSVGPKYGLESAGIYSVAFHKIHHPQFQARLHALLHPELCRRHEAW